MTEERFEDKQPFLPHKLSDLDSVSEDERVTKPRRSSLKRNLNTQSPSAKDVADEEPVIRSKTLQKGSDKPKGWKGTQSKHPPRQNRTGPSSRHTKPLTPTRIRNIVNFQIEQRETCSGKIRQSLNRRAIPWLNTLSGEELATAQEDLSRWVEEEIVFQTKRGFVNDLRYASLKARLARDKGHAQRRIVMDLRKAGLPDDVIDEALKEADEETMPALEDSDILHQEGDEIAARELARRRKIGPFRVSPSPEDFASRQKLWRREAGILARAGFGLDLVSKVLSAPPEEDDDLFSS